VSVEVCFETHSTSIDNELGIATGWNEGELSEAGRRQAVRLGDRRRNDRIAVVFTSDLRRAVQTAELAFAGSQLPIVRDRRLRECNYGELNGMPRAQLEAERLLRIDEPFPGGESWRQAVDRVAGFLHELPRSHDGERVLVIGHVATRWALDRVVFGVSLDTLAATPFEWREGWEYTLHTREGAPLSLERPQIEQPVGDIPFELGVEDLVVGDGAEATAGKKVTVHYVGVSFSTGVEFDASWNRDTPFEFKLGKGQVIPGWDAGVEGMRVGGRRKLTIPSAMAYGARGAGSAIKPHDPLVFVVDLLSVSS
jgi:broad specificity phosphatase PhoE